VCSGADADADAIVMSRLMGTDEHVCIWTTGTVFVQGGMIPIGW